MDIAGFAHRVLGQESGCLPAHISCDLCQHGGPPRRVERGVVDVANKLRKTVIFFHVIQRAGFALGRCYSDVPMQLRLSRCDRSAGPAAQAVTYAIRLESSWTRAQTNWPRARSPHIINVSVGAEPKHFNWTQTPVHPETKGRRCPIAGETARKRQDVDKALAIALRCAPNFESVSYSGSVLT